MFIDDEIGALLRRLSGSLDSEGLLGGPAADSSLHSGPHYYGYTMTVGPDGRPVVREYGNVRPDAQSTPADVRQPLVDTITDEKENVVKLVAEMPGVEKGDIKVVVEAESVDISAERGEKKYRARTPVGDGIDPDSGRATYKNGVLEVSFRRIPQKPTGKTVEVN